MLKDSNKNLYVYPLIVSILLFILGGIMIVNNLSVYGLNLRTHVVSGFGGHLLILIGVISLIVTYYSFSPFSKIRNLDKMFTKRRKHSKP